MKEKISRKAGRGLRIEKDLRVVKDAGFATPKREKSVNRRAGLHDKKKNLKGEKRIYRRKPLALRHKRRLRKVAVALSAVFVAAVSYIGLGFLIKPDMCVEELGNNTVCAVKRDSLPAEQTLDGTSGKVYYFPEDGSLPTDHTLIENVAYMNYVLKNQPYWSSEMHSTVYTVMKQYVHTYKQFYGDKLISADIAEGASNTARQFCVTDTDVMWREAKGKIDAMNSDWSTGKAFGLTIPNFRIYRGLPANEFSVYILDELTVKNANDYSVVENEDGTYTMTLDLNVQNNTGLESAVHYYKQQMYVTGGLYAWPTFEYTTVSYTFTKDWVIKEFTIKDKYTAKMGTIKAGCSSESTTVFDYSEENAVNTFYEDYFKSQEGKYTVWKTSSAQLDAATCLSSAFGSVLEDGATLKADLTLGNKPVSGVVHLGLDGGDINDLRVKLGSIGVYLGDDNGKKTLFAALGANKFKMSLDGFTGQPESGEASAQSEDSAVAGLLDTEDLLNQLFGGEFSLAKNKKSATLKSEIEVFGLKIKIEFAFKIKKNVVSLDYLSAEFNLGDTPVKARVTFGTEADIPAELTAREKALYTDLSDGLTLGAKLKLDGLALDGSVFIGLSDGGLGEIRAQIGGVKIYYVPDDKNIYVAAGAGLKIKLNPAAINLGGGSAELDGEALAGIIEDVVKNIKLGEGSLSTNTQLNVLGQALKLALALNINDSLTVSAGAEIFGKTASIEVGFAENKIPALGDRESYVDVISDGFTLKGALEVNAGGKIIALDVNGLSFNFNGGFSFELGAQLKAEDLVFDIYASYQSGELTLVYGDKNNCVGVQLNTTDGLNTLKGALRDLLNRLYAVMDEIVTNADEAVTLQNLKALVSQIEFGEAGTSGISEIFGLLGGMLDGGAPDAAGILTALGIPCGSDGNLDIAALIGAIAVMNSGNGITLTVGENLALNLGIGDSGLSLELGTSVAGVSLTDISVVGAYNGVNCPVDESVLLTADDLAEMLDYLAAAAELLVEDEYSLSATASVYEEEIKSYDVGVIFEYIRGEKFPVHITLPVADGKGNTTAAKVTLDDDMYWHLAVNLERNENSPLSYEEDADGNSKLKDNLYVDVYILDANPQVADSGDKKGKTTGLKNGAGATGGGLDMYLTISRYAVGTSGYAPLKLYAPVNELLTILSAGVALLDLQGIDISDVSKELQSVIDVIADLLDDTLVKAFLPDTHSQFQSLGASLIPQFLNTDISGLLKGILQGLASGGSEEAAGGNAEEPNAPLPAVSMCGNYVNNVKFTDDNGNCKLSIVLNSEAIYGSSAYDNLSFEVCKYRTPITANADGDVIYEQGKSYITGASINNIYYGGNGKLDLGLNITRSVDRLEDFSDYYDFSCIDTLLKAFANSITHATSDHDKAVANELGLADTAYTLNHYYLINGTVTANLTGKIMGINYNVDVPIAVTLSITIDEYTNDVVINAHLEYSAKKVSLITAINGDSVVDLTIKGGMIYVKRVQTSDANGKAITPVTIHRVMPLSVFAENIMDNISFIINLGDTIAENLPSDTSGSSLDFTGYDYGKTIGTFLAYFQAAESGNKASWTAAICGDILTQLIGMEMSDLTIEFTAQSAYDAVSGTKAYVVTGLEIKETTMKLFNAGIASGNLKLSGSLSYCNPNEVLVSGSQDKAENQAPLWEGLFGLDSSEIAESEVWAQTLANLTANSGKYPSAADYCKYLIIEANASQGVGLSKITVCENGAEIDSITVLYGTTDGMLSVAPAAPEFKDRVGYDLNVIYSGVENVGGKLYATDFANASVNAVYTAQTYTVTLVGSFNEYVFSKEQEYTYGTELSLMQYMGAAYEGYSIIAFEIDGVRYYGSVPAGVITSDVTLNAVWEKIDENAEFTVTYVAGDTTVETLTVIYGGEIDLSVACGVSVTGYDFAGWNYDGLLNVYCDRVVRAEYTAHTYSVSLDLNGYDCGEAAVAAGFEYSGSAYSLPYIYDSGALIPEPLGNIHGYDFLYYTYADGTVVTDIMNITEDVTLYPVFEDVMIHVTVSSDIGFTYDGKTAEWNGSEYALAIDLYRDNYVLADAVGYGDGAEYTFMSWWYYTEDGNGEKTFFKAEDMLDIARPGEIVSVEIKALWGKVAVDAKSTKSGFIQYTYKLDCSVSIEFVGYEEIIQTITRTGVNYEWQIGSLSSDKVTSPQGGNELSFSASHKAVTTSKWTVGVSVALTYYGENQITLMGSAQGNY